HLEMLELCLGQASLNLRVLPTIRAQPALPAMAAHPFPPDEEFAPAQTGGGHHSEAIAVVVRAQDPSPPALRDVEEEVSRSLVVRRPGAVDTTIVGGCDPR